MFRSLLEGRREKDRARELARMSGEDPISPGCFLDPGAKAPLDRLNQVSPRLLYTIASCTGHEGGSLRPFINARVSTQLGKDFFKKALQDLEQAGLLDRQAEQIRPDILIWRQQHYAHFIFKKGKWQEGVAALTVFLKKWVENKPS